mmetsp:Transcript_13968/g.36240  ORF Transcript_13968/g.36240 Transcript_13968/m.36240 type:complete len:510 (+) Transcript_13968:56-1585(+)
MRRASTLVTAAAAAVLLLAGADARHETTSGDAPSTNEVKRAAWTFILSSAAHQPAGTTAEAFCKTALVSIVRYFPDEAYRSELVRILQSPVVSDKLQWLPTMDDCAILLWYIRTVDQVASDDAPRSLLHEIGVQIEAFAFEPDDASTREALSLWTSEAKRSAVLAHLDRNWVGHDLEHAQLHSAKPAVDLAVFSACPYGIIAEQAMLGKVVGLFGDSIDFNMRYIGMSRFAGPNGTMTPDEYCAEAKKEFKVELSDTDENVCSMHGSGEANEDLRQMAIRDLYGADVLHKYILAFNELECEADKYDSCFPKAAKALELDTKAIIEKVGESLQAYAAEMSEFENTVGVKAKGSADLSSPTLIVNGFLGAIGALSASDYARRICYFFDDETKPALCDPELLGKMDTEEMDEAAEDAEQQDGKKAHQARAAHAAKGGSCLRPEGLPRAVPQPQAPPGWRRAGGGGAALTGASSRMWLAALGAAGLPVALAAGVLAVRTRASSPTAPTSHPLV